jgi:hypothetical protein
MGKRKGVRKMTIPEYVSLYDIQFTLKDENGDDIENKNGKVKIYRLKDNIRFKPLEYITDDISIDMVEEIK